MTIADQLATVQRSLGELTAGHRDLLRGQEDARNSRVRIYERMEESDARFYERMAQQDAVLAELTAQVRTITVTAQMNNEAAVKLLERINPIEGTVLTIAPVVDQLDVTVKEIEPIVSTLHKTVTEIEPMARLAAAFRIEAMPIVKIVKQVRLAIIGLIAFFTMFAGVIGWAYANAGPILRTLVIEWLKAGGPAPIP